jgi:hypothetical protein
LRVLAVLGIKTSERRVIPGKSDYFNLDALFIDQVSITKFAELSSSQIRKRSRMFASFCVLRGEGRRPRPKSFQKNPSAFDFNISILDMAQCMRSFDRLLDPSNSRGKDLEKVGKWCLYIIQYPKGLGNIMMCFKLF